MDADEEGTVEDREQETRPRQRILRRPTREELRQDVWRPEEPGRTFVRRRWGVGWSLNLFRVLRRG